MTTFYFTYEVLTERTSSYQCQISIPERCRTIATLLG